VCSSDLDGLILEGDFAARSSFRSGPGNQTDQQPGQPRPHADTPESCGQFQIFDPPRDNRRAAIPRVDAVRDRTIISTPLRCYWRLSDRTNANIPHIDVLRASIGRAERNAQRHSLHGAAWGTCPPPQSRGGLIACALTSAGILRCRACSCRALSEGYQAQRMSCEAPPTFPRRTCPYPRTWKWRRHTSCRNPPR